MKWNATTVSATCLIVGIAGFAAGKISQAPSEPTEADKLLSRSERISSVGSATQDRAGRESSRTSDRTRMSSRTGTTFDERLGSMEEIIRGENALDRGRAMLAWIDSLAPSEFEEAVARFRSLGLTQARMGEYAMLMTAWAEVDPMAALAYTTENTQGGMATDTVLTAWASRDPDSAIAWAKANYDGDDANPYLTGIIRGLAETDAPRATGLLQEMPYSRERGQALGAMMPHLLQLGPDAAKGWIAELSDERLRDGATGRFAEQLAKEDPAGTASWLLANLGEASTRSVDEVFEEWAKTDPEAALGSFETIPEGDARSRALRGMVTIEAREDPQAAADLMNRFPEDRDDRMVQHFVWNSFQKDPGVAVSQIAGIENEGRRNRTYDRLLDAWIEEEPDAARRWIGSANLPDNVLKNINGLDIP